MNNKLAQKCHQDLKNSEYWTPRTKENGRTIANLICPACGDKTAWANQNEPYSINCNRANECGARTKTRELFDIKFDIEKEYPVLKSDPHRPAREYLKSRGLNDDTLKGLDFRYWKNTRKGLKTGAVMFPIGQDDKGKECLNGRLINPPQGTKNKGHNYGSTSGKYWKHPLKPIDPYIPVFITEGVINALSIIQMGGQAIAVLSSGQAPENLKILDQYQLVCAFDADQAGTSATKRYMDVFPNAGTIMPDNNSQDWNDILQQNPRTAAERFKENNERYKQNAELNLAESAHHYGKLFYEFFNKVPGLFTFNGSTWLTELRTKGETPTPKTERVGLFTIEVLSFINIGTGTQKDFLYQLRVKPHKERPVECVASGRSLASAKDFGTFLLSRACVNFEGSTAAITALATWITVSKAPEVRQMQTVGYCPQSKWYVFDTFAVDPKGKVHYKDKKGLFKVGTNDRVTPAPQANEKAIEPSKTPKVNIQTIHRLIYESWGYNGATAFSWIMASWFVNQVKDRISFFPYADFSGLPAAGKSAMVTKLQACQAVDGEGLNVSETSTKKGIARKIHGLSGMFCALLEFTEENVKSMGFVNILSAYNKGGGDMIQAKFTADLETKDTPLLCALMFCQNRAPWKNTQEKQRAISLHFDTKDLNANTLHAYNILNDIPKEELAAVMVEILKNRGQIESEWHEEYRIACADLERVKEERIRNNHALLLAFHRLACKIFGIQINIFEHIEQVALLKEKTSAELEINEASLFFEQIFSSSSEQKDKYWHEVEEPQRANSMDSNSLYFSLTEMLRLLQNEGLQPPKPKELQEALKRHPAYIGHSINHRFPNPPIDNKQGPLFSQRKAWKLDLAKFKEVEDPPTQGEKERVW